MACVQLQQLLQPLGITNPTNLKCHGACYVRATVPSHICVRMPHNLQNLYGNWGHAGHCTLDNSLPPLQASARLENVLLGRWLMTIIYSNNVLSLNKWKAVKKRTNLECSEALIVLEMALMLCSTWFFLQWSTVNQHSYQSLFHNSSLTSRFLFRR